MQRCLHLASLGAGTVAPNPMVGSVLVYQNRIIGEGHHRQYGSAHAEVNCINSVQEKDKHLIAHSTLYVSLEPCAHFGKTPPCADLIVRMQIPRVVIGCRDPFEAVNGKGIEKLRAAGIEVTVPVCEKECIDLNKRFFTYHLTKRPYIILKWAQTADAKMAADNNNRLLISNELTNRKVHHWRSEEAAILVGTNTALRDNPKLDNRLWTGKSPTRLVIDKSIRLPAHLHLFSGLQSTIVFNFLRDGEEGNLKYYKLENTQNIASSVCNALYRLQIQSVLIEGGSQVLQSFIDNHLWDEARIITNPLLYIGNGLSAPSLQHQKLVTTETILTDRIDYFIHSNIA